MQHPNNMKLKHGWRRKPLAVPEADDNGQRWTRQSLAVAWHKSERQVDRIRKAGLLGDPVGRVGKTDLYSNAQKLAAERAGLVTP
jgi:hypothetical protein